MAEQLPLSPPWDGVDLRTKYEWFKDRPGQGATHRAAEGLATEAATMDESAAFLARTMRGSGVDWRGSAAVAVSSSMARAAAWGANSARTAGTGGSGVDNYGLSWTKTKNQIAPPVPEGPSTMWDWVRSGLMGGKDYVANQVVNWVSERNANQALAEHDAYARRAVAEFADLDPVPATTDTVGSGAAHPGPPAGPGGTRPGGGRPLGRRVGGVGPGAPGPGGPPAVVAGGQPVGGGARAGAVSAGGSPAPGGDDRTGGTADPGGHQTIPVGTRSADAAPGGLSGSGPGRVPPAGDRLPVPGVGIEPVSPWPVPAGPPASTGAPRPPLGRDDYRPGRITEVLNPRGGAEPAPHPGPTPSSAGPAAARGPVGSGMVPPMGGAGASGHERTHRNNTYLPSDEPFVVEFDGVVPPVIEIAVGDHPGPPPSAQASR